MRLETQFSASRRLALGLACLSSLVLPAALHAADIPAPAVSLAWNPNPEPDVAGYKVHFGTRSGVYSEVIDVPGTNSIRLPQLFMGFTYYVAVSAYDTEGLEGPRSAELAVTAALPSPAIGTAFSMGSAGQGKLQWKYSKSAAATAEGFSIYSSEDLESWSPAGSVRPDQSTSSDAQWLYFNFPYQVTKPRMFFRVVPGNAFGEAK